MTQEQALMRLQSALDGIPLLQSVIEDSTEFQKWHRDTTVTLTYIFGAATTHVLDFKTIFGRQSVYAGIGPDDVARQKREAFKRQLQSAEGVLLSIKQEISDYWSERSEPMGRKEPLEYTLDVFVSHSGSDVILAEALIDLLRAALTLEVNKIRCTSVSGYGLSGGATTDATLRQEVKDAKCFLGILTPASLESQYVIWELGARWGTERHFVPLVASGIDKKELQAPLSNLNVLSCSNGADLHQLISELAARLKKPQLNPAIYQKHIDRIVSLSNQTSANVGQGYAIADLPQMKVRSIEPETEAGKALLDVIRTFECPLDKKGITEIHRSIMPGMIMFLPSLIGSGSPMNMKARLFREGIQELQTKGWLYEPEVGEKTTLHEYKQPE